VSFFRKLHYTTEQDFEVIVHSIFPSSNGAAAIINKYCEGSLRSFENIIPILRELQLKKGSELTEAMIKNAANQLMLVD
jgi:NADH:ubiquinone oxidoreductase subunit E